MLDENTAIDLAVALIEAQEGCELQAYADPESPLGRATRLSAEKRPDGWAQLDGAPWTIGYGSTHGVRLGMTITKDEALYRLRIDLQLAIHALKAKVADVYAELTNHQAAALYDFVFNLGTGDPKKPEWTIWRVIRARRFDQVPGELVKFVNAQGHKVMDLVRRRNAEVELWSTNEPGTVEIEAPSSVMRNIDTPPTPVDPVPALKSAHLWTLGVGSVAAIPPAVKAAADQVTQWVSPYADQAPLLHQVMNACGIAAAGALVAGGVWAYATKRWARN